MMFVCERCRDGDHCGKPDGERNTWCDCEHRVIITDDVVIEPRDERDHE